MGRRWGRRWIRSLSRQEVDLRELRGFAFGPDGDLYVANAYKDASQVLRFAGQPGPDGKHLFREVYAERHDANPGLDHPFDVAFGPDSHLYVASQDTNIVGRYYGPHETEGKPGTPMPHPEALQDADTKHLLPGTFIPSQEHARGGLQRGAGRHLRTGRGSLRRGSRRGQHQAVRRQQR